MKNLTATHFTRRIDELGRIVLPKELRDKAHIPEKGSVDISYSDGKIIIENEKPHCLICGSTDNINKNISICSKCIEQIKNDEI